MEYIVVVGTQVLIGHVSDSSLQTSDAIKPPYLFFSYLCHLTGIRGSVLTLGWEFFQAKLIKLLPPCFKKLFNSAGSQVLNAYQY